MPMPEELCRSITAQAVREGYTHQSMDGYDLGEIEVENTTPALATLPDVMNTNALLPADTSVLPNSILESSAEAEVNNGPVDGMVPAMG
jgi:hypothetical protein